MTLVNIHENIEILTQIRTTNNYMSLIIWLQKADFSIGNKQFICGVKQCSIAFITKLYIKIPKENRLNSSHYYV